MDLKNIFTFIHKAFYLDLRSLALFRIGLGLLSLYNLYGIYPDVDSFLGVNSIAPLSAFKPGTNWSLYAVSDNQYFIRCLFALHAFFAVMLILGFRTRFATIICWIMTVSLGDRVPIMVYGADKVMQVFLMWGAFLPLGARFSLDSRMGFSDEKLPNNFISMATIAFICQLIMIYVFNSQARTNACWTKDYTALFYVFNYHEFAKPLATWLLNFPQFLQSLTFLSFLLELYGGLLLLIPFFYSFFRSIAVVLFILFHFGIHLTLNLDWFPAVMIICWVALIPSSWWNNLNSQGENNRISAIKFKKARDIVICLILSYVLVINYRYVAMKRFHPEWKENHIENFGKILGIYQKWNMFHLDFPEWQGRYYVFAIGNSIMQPIEIPTTGRWKSILRGIHQEKYMKYYEHVKIYFTNRWNKEHSQNKQIMSVKIEYRPERINIPLTSR